MFFSISIVAAIPLSLRNSSSLSSFLTPAASAAAIHHFVMTCVRLPRGIARANGEPEGTAKAFYTNLPRRGFIRAKTGGLRVYRGIALKRRDTWDA